MSSTILKRKRTRTADSYDEDDKRRGRPRVEKQDESAADRRRTQIRMAQRAYRQRKESTLEDLRKRVSDLTNTIELMNKIFTEFKDRLKASSLSEGQVFNLHEASAQLEQLVQDARNPTEDGNTQPVAVHRDSAASLVSGSPSANPEETYDSSSWLDKAAVASTRQANVDDAVVSALGYRWTTENGDLPQATETSITAKAKEIPQPQIIPDYQPSAVDNSRLGMFYSIPSDLSPPRTYSFQETSFARRVLRACLEHAYHTVLNPDLRQDEYHRAFRLALMCRDRSKIVASLKSRLDRGPHEDLDISTAALLHIGGAGTHFPRRDTFGNIVPKKESYNLGLMGPQALALLENAARDNISIDMTVSIAGFEGEWYDSHDVQGYLEEKGIFIDPASSFAEAEVTEWPQGSSSSSSIASSVSSQTFLDPSLTPLSPLAGHQLGRLNEMDADLSRFNEFTDISFGTVGYTDAQSGSWMNFLEPAQSNKMSDSNPSSFETSAVEFIPNLTDRSFVSDSRVPSPQPRKKTIIIDVSKFVQALTVTGVCLGRSPGFRRRDVDRALAVSSVDAFY